MDTAKLTLKLPRRDLEFAEEYARLHRITISELVDRYLRRLRIQSGAKSRLQAHQDSVDAWQEFFRLGEQLAAEGEGTAETETLTATLLSMRR